MVEGKITVIHLVWLPAGFQVFQKFIDSYKAHPSGYPHDFHLIFNGMGVSHPVSPEKYLSYAAKIGVVISGTSYFDHGQDIEAYRKAAKELGSDFLFVINSYSLLLADDWLSKYMRNMSDHVGAISATGSLQSHYSTVFTKLPLLPEWEKGFGFNFRKYKLFIKAIFYWRFLFPRFPNPHLRTNALLIRREHFLAVRMKVNGNKFRAYRFESGRNGLSYSLKKGGLELLVVDRFGKAYFWKDWKNSNTFWVNDQDSVIISDNQTEVYAKADSEEKRMMTLVAWGN